MSRSDSYFHKAKHEKRKAQATVLFRDVGSNKVGKQDTMRSSIGGDDLNGAQNVEVYFCSAVLHITGQNLLINFSEEMEMHIHKAHTQYFYLSSFCTLLWEQMKNIVVRKIAIDMIYDWLKALFQQFY